MPLSHKCAGFALPKGLPRTLWKSGVSCARLEAQNDELQKKNLKKIN